MSTEQPAERTALRVGFVPGVTLRKWRTIWEERFRRVDLDVVEVPQNEQRRMLDAGEADLCFVRLPLDTDGLHLIPLYEEIPVAWTSKDHAIAAVDDLALDDLDGEVVLTEVTPDALQQAAFADAVLVVPMSIARTHSRRDLIYRPITDAPTTRIGLAWRVDDDNPWIDEFIGVVRGRTANSSRSAQERAKTPKPAPAKTRGTKQARPAHWNRGRR
ncbi:MAG: LysR substrate-binding domain-containing protein [Propioniciclava sp.]|uniref:LysR substrate-binding domain-containing protein n=1 Tax=Propioniciclava sp. TaxID=2038686 RepID=UPI0039E2CF9C